MKNLTTSIILITVLAISSSFYAIQSTKFSGNKGRLQFKSDAPLEMIQAESKDLIGVIDTEKNAFAFSIYMNTFEGFNNPLQKVHFNENYVESEKFPKSTFSGKIIESIDYTKPGTYNVRAKGNLSIHGISAERTINAKLIIKADRTISIQSTFEVGLEDHEIQIPSIVNQKVAESIILDLNIDLAPKN